MSISRRKFLTLLGVTGVAAVGGFAVVKAFMADSAKKVTGICVDGLNHVTAIMEELQREGSNIVVKTLNGKKYKRGEKTHYPIKKAVRDLDTKCRIFFHAHRKNEYGHFHTFHDNEEGDFVHLIMISMDEEGRPTCLSTLNKWVTGEAIVDTPTLKEMFLSFRMDTELFPDKRIIAFVEAIFLAYKKEILELLDERDAFINAYKEENGEDPFKDKSIEVFSYRNINVYEDIRLGAKGSYC